MIEKLSQHNFELEGHICGRESVNSRITSCSDLHYLIADVIGIFSSPYFRVAFYNRQRIKGDRVHARVVPARKKKRTSGEGAPDLELTDSIFR